MKKIEERKEEIMKLYADGYEYSQMSVVLPFSKTALREYCRNLILSGEMEKRKKHRPRKTKFVREQYLLGEKDLDTLARRFGVKKRSIEQYLIGLGRGKMCTEKAIAIAMDLAQSTYNCHLATELAKKHGVTRQYVYYVIKHFERYAKEIKVW